MQTPRPKAWKFGRKVKNECSALINSGTKYFAPRAWALKLRLDNITPFGLPVVPPDYIMAAGSLALTLVCGLPINLLALDKN